MTFPAFLSADTVRREAAAHGGLTEFALSLLDKAAGFAYAPVSRFYVGAVAADDAGNLYLGANQECAAAIGQTVHAEQSAVANAWAHGARRITDIAVNYTPCGHCRQFLNELRGAEDLRIHLPHSRNNRLHDYLPDSFGPADLNMNVRLLDEQHHDLRLQQDGADALTRAAFQAACESYAPYSGAFAGAALQTADGKIYAGRYAENAAYNPSLPPLQAALNALRLDGGRVETVRAAVLVSVAHGGHESHARALWQSLSDVPLRVCVAE